MRDDIDERAMREMRERDERDERLFGKKKFVFPRDERDMGAGSTVDHNLWSTGNIA